MRTYITWWLRSTLVVTQWCSRLQSALTTNSRRQLRAYPSTARTLKNPFSSTVTTPLVTSWLGRTGPRCKSIRSSCLRITITQQARTTLQHHRTRWFWHAHSRKCAKRPCLLARNPSLNWRGALTSLWITAGTRTVSKQSGSTHQGCRRPLSRWKQWRFLNGFSTMGRRITWIRSSKRRWSRSKYVDHDYVLEYIVKTLKNNASNLLNPQPMLCS